jgi:phosphoribosylamine---glycine ligase
MQVLVIGGGGREHALVWKIAQSRSVQKIFCAPGNAGIANQAECVPLSAEDVPALLAFAEKERIDLTVVGPEAPLTLGIVDVFEERGLRIFGPSRRAAAIEGSKALSKEIMRKYRIPSAEFRVFEDFSAAAGYIREKNAPLVVKADGLAAGKGVILCGDAQEALEALNRIMVRREFGTAGQRVVVEEFLQGEEASFLVFTDGESILPLPTSQDHKAIFDDDKGPNTGGMGAYSPAPVITEEIHRTVMEEIMRPTIRALAAEGRRYRGVLYAGLMIRDGRPKVLEFNARLGDPETQPLLFRLQSDIVPLMEATIEGTLGKIRAEWDPRPAVCVVMASGGYPGSYAKGKIISGLDRAAGVPGAFVFHAGTAFKDGRVVTSGGRVLGVTAAGSGIREAIETAYRAVEQIAWEGVQYRRDIGHKALNRKA